MSITKNKLNVLPFGPVPIDAETMRDMELKNLLPEGIMPPIKFIEVDPDIDENGFVSGEIEKACKGVFY